jgi:hypothetical protein
MKNSKELMNLFNMINKNYDNYRGPGKAKIKIINYLEKLSKSGLKRFVSDPKWNYISQSTYSSNREKMIYSTIGSISSSYLIKFDISRDILIRHSVGAIFIHTFESVSKKSKKRMSKRICQKTKDVRIKKRIIRYVGKTNLINMYKKEKNKAVVSKIQDFSNFMGIELPYIKGREVSTPYAKILSMPLTQLDIELTFNWSLFRECYNYTFEDCNSDQIQEVLDKLKGVVRLMEEVNFNNEYEIKACLSKLLCRVLYRMKKIDAIRNMDLSHIGDLFRNMHSYYRIDISNELNSILNSKWTN